MTAPEPAGKASFWYTTTVLAAAAFSLALIVDQALIVAAGRHLVGRIDAWLASLQPEPAQPRRTFHGPLIDVDALRQEHDQRQADKGAAATEEHSETDSETPGL